MPEEFKKLKAEIKRLSNQELHFNCRLEENHLEFDIQLQMVSVQVDSYTRNGRAKE